MRAAGEGGDPITELASDPVSYKNSYKTSGRSDGQTASLTLVGYPKFPGLVGGEGGLSALD